MHLNWTRSSPWRHEPVGCPQGAGGAACPLRTSAGKSNGNPGRTKSWAGKAGKISSSLFMTARKSGRKCCHASRGIQVWSRKISSLVRRAPGRLSSRHGEQRGSSARSSASSTPPLLAAPHTNATSPASAFPRRKSSPGMMRSIMLTSPAARMKSAPRRSKSDG